MFKKALYILVAVVGLVLIRVFENSLFYDPFIEYFKMDYQFEPFPHYELSKLLFSNVLRFSANALLSILIIHAVFLKKALNVFSFKLFGVVLLILTLIFSFLLISEVGENNKLAFFYVRRFLIQPLFLFILVPAFYYQQLTDSEK